ncbi:hypothetical protein [Pelosinus propionicus]|uniref:Uncharacterized protein n=1 Tax=Pelosinus propionicus DSM 13327 TaxID=1123291 RepID=A0A1I4K1V7_9FIRM|nr:hypothetical protein [Pelosinus propionicus]SFL72551.1 hypothetical protein SAMN04490355_101547 [Pelosinus propionicus DSM 13327]
MLKLRTALCLALIVGTLTLLNGMLQGARLETIIYRIIVSVAIFGFIGYGLGLIVERFFKKIALKKLNEKYQSDTLKENEPSDDVTGNSEFAPFTSTSFEQITRPKE